MEKLEQERELTGEPWEVVPEVGFAGGGAQGFSLSSLNMDEHIWEHWWAAHLGALVGGTAAPYVVGK